ncbi:MAG: hypothetical protein ABSA72_02050 [Nitrososphaerales archaeon]|jgi:flagellar protein FlaJ
MTQQATKEERKEAVKGEGRSQSKEEDELQIKPIRLGKGADLEFNAFMLLLACIKDIDVASGDFIKGISAMSNRGYISQVFLRMRTLVTQWNYKAQDATTIMAKGLPKSEFKQFLEKLAQALSAGVRLREFNRVQSTKYMIQFDANYSRVIDRLRQVSEMFSALVSSISFMAVSMLIASMTVGLGNPMTVLITTCVAVIVTVFTMVFLIRTFTPRERVLIKGDYLPFNLHRFHKINRPLLIICAFVGIGLPAILLQFHPFSGNLGLAIGLPMAVAGAPLIVVGRVARKRVEKVTRSEEQYSAFIKNFGEAYAVTASTRESVRILTHGDYGGLDEEIYNMLARLDGGMTSETAWKFFSEDTGSYLIQYHTEALRDSLALGASGARSSEEVFTSFNAAQSRRKKREQVSGFLKAMVTPLQLTFAAVLTFVQAIVVIFSLIASQAAQYMVLLRPVDPNLVAYYSLAIVAACLVGSALGISIVEGQSEFDLPYSLGIHLVATGVIVGITAFAAGLLLGQFSNINLGSTTI